MHVNGDEQGWLPSTAVQPSLQHHLDIVSIAVRWALGGGELGVWSLPSSDPVSVLLQAAEDEAGGELSLVHGGQLLIGPETLASLGLARCPPH